MAAISLLQPISQTEEKIGREQQWIKPVLPKPQCVFLSLVVFSSLSFESELNNTQGWRSSSKFLFLQICPCYSFYYAHTYISKQRWQQRQIHWRYNTQRLTLLGRCPNFFCHLSLNVESDCSCLSKWDFFLRFYFHMTASSIPQRVSVNLSENVKGNWKSE